jgi:hypothetical protein
MQEILISVSFPLLCTCNVVFTRYSELKVCTGLLIPDDDARSFDHHAVAAIDVDREA